MMEFEQYEAEHTGITNHSFVENTDGGGRLMLWLGLFFIVLAFILLGNLANGKTIAPEVETAVLQLPERLEPQAAPADVLDEPESAITGNDETVIQVSLPENYGLNVSFGDLGPRLLSVGAIDYDRFLTLYEQTGRPLTVVQQEMLSEGGDYPIVIDFANAQFLLNFFWALGLTNQNPILTEGPMVQYSEGDISRFASTGGWTLGQYPATQLYASDALIPLTVDQQARLEQVAYGVYRPCCNNHTAFADCNHGMAMLGLLTLLASQDASEAEMFAAAKAVNGFWYPQQAVETAVFFQAAMGLAYADVDPQMAVGREAFSSSGFQQVHQWLADNNLLEQAPTDGGSCGVS